GDAAGGDAVSDRLDRGRVQVGRGLHRQGYAVSVALREQVALRGQGGEERVEAVGLLQRAQILRVGRGNVRGDEARVRVHLAQAGDVILVRALVRGVRVFSDVHADDAAVARAADVLHEGIGAAAVETEAIDERPGLGEAK